MPDPVSASGIEALNPRARSLHGLYEEGAPRTARPTSEWPRRSSSRCGPGSASARRSTATRASSSCPRTMRSAAPALRDSTRRCFPASPPRTALSPDLGVDPAVNGMQSYEAGDFLRRRPATSRRLRSCSGRSASWAPERRRRMSPRRRYWASSWRSCSSATRPATSGRVRSVFLSRRRRHRPRPAARGARTRNGHPRVNAVRAASSSLSARARRAATTFPFAS